MFAAFMSVVFLALFLGFRRLWLSYVVSLTHVLECVTRI